MPGRVLRALSNLIPLGLLALLLWTFAGVIRGVWRQPLVGVMIVLCIVVAVPVCVAMDALRGWRERRRQRGFDVTPPP